VRASSATICSAAESSSTHGEALEIALANSCRCPARTATSAAAASVEQTIVIARRWRDPKARIRQI
jgi:hypothetical protein